MRHGEIESGTALVGIDSKSQRPGSDERHHVAPPLPGSGLTQRRDQFIVSLRPRRRAIAILQLTGYENHGIARD
jgi:hypothetical protein